MMDQWVGLLVWLGVGVASFVFAAVLVRRQCRAGARDVAVGEDPTTDVTVLPPTLQPHRIAS